MGDCDEGDGVETLNDSIQQKLLAVVEDLLERRKLLEKTWDAFDPHLFRILFFFIRTCCPHGHHLREKATEIFQRERMSTVAHNASEILPMVVEIDEQLFFRKYRSSSATDTRSYRTHGCIGQEAENALEKLADADIEHMKKNISVMRKYTCLAIMQHIKDEG